MSVPKPCVKLKPIIIIVFLYILSKLVGLECKKLCNRLVRPKIAVHEGYIITPPAQEIILCHVCSLRPISKKFASFPIPAIRPKFMAYFFRRPIKWQKSQSDTQAQQILYPEYMAWEIHVWVIPVQNLLCQSSFSANQHRKCPANNQDKSQSCRLW